ncbi:MAG: single-stranded-DNA-specific exonuclease RecJ [Chlamydiae bacterium SM23_39]|nr:MAG: single-stranded-DNA-specific exonuclease RecJ [Chlamydiae bacterium SM23_39]
MIKKSYEKEQEILWMYPKNDPVFLKKIIDEFNIHPVTAQILISRGFNSLEDIHDHLYAKLPNLYDPYLFKDMDKAVERIIHAIKNKEGILIYGDNDVDGMTATALLSEFLAYINADVFYFIPNANMQRKNVMKEVLKYALKKRCSLIITVDCGITSADEIEYAIKNKVDVIVTDHHEPISKIPNCIATLNPKLLNNTYPNRDITGVGVAFKLAHAITDYLIKKKQINKSKIDLKLYLDLVALGTIADMGVLLGENRIFIRYGIEQLKKTQRIGLLKLFHICEISKNDLTPIDIAAKVAPRLNSLGRIADPSKGVKLLLVRDEQTASSLAEELDLYNIKRQKIERLASEDIDIYIKKNPKILENKAIVLCSNKWHPGIIPIITARIAKQYNRPTMLIAIERNIGKGSLRTIPEFPILSVLKKKEDLIINFGGHDYAAGLTILEENIPKLKKFFISYANRVLKDRDVISKLYLDAAINFKDLTFDFMESVKLLEPFGTENPPPILYCDAYQSWKPKIVGKIHLKFYLVQNDRSLEGIGFGMGYRRHLLIKKDVKLKIAFIPQINTFLNKSSIQLQIKDFKVF